MLRTALLAVALLVPGLLSAVDAPMPPDATPQAASPMAAQPCSDYQKHFPPCGLSKSDNAKARKLYKAATDLARKKRFSEALDKLHEVRAISPRDAVYAAAQATIQQKVVSAEIRNGNQAMLKGDPTLALSSFRHAAELDPANEYAQQRLRDALPNPQELSSARLRPQYGETRLQPAAGVHSFEFSGNSSELLQQFARSYGISSVPENALTPRHVRVKLDDVNWETGSAILARVCKVLFIPLSEHQAMLVNDTEENRRDLTRMSLRTFYALGGINPQQLTDLVTSLRILFDLKYISPNLSVGTIVIRAPQQTMDAVTRFVDYLQDERPAVMLEVKVFQISTAFNRDLGTSIPSQFTVFNVPTEVNSLVNSSTYSEILSALQASGQTVNATTILAALLASSSSTSTSVLSQPFAVFGGGTTLSGVTIPSTSLNFSVTNSMTRTVDDVLLRAGHGQVATMKVGERYPIVSSQFSATSAASSLLSTLGLSTTTAAAIPSPQFNYEDLGLTLKANPQVHGKLVSLDYELTLRSLGTIQVNGLPLITNREVKGAISTIDGEPVVIAGLVDKEEMASINGIPLLSMIPVLGKAFSVATKEKTYDELLVVLTPHISSARTQSGAYIYLPTNVPK